jgi:hypothetical protein
VGKLLILLGLCGAKQNHPGSCAVAAGERLASCSGCCCSGPEMVKIVWQQSLKNIWNIKIFILYLYHKPIKQSICQKVLKFVSTSAGVRTT